MTELTTAPPLTKLSEEEGLFRDTVRDFAERDVKPRVAAMEQASALDPSLIAKCFELGSWASTSRRRSVARAGAS